MTRSSYLIIPEEPMPIRLAPKLLAEFVGTFAFVFIGAGTAAVVGDARRRRSGENSEVGLG